MLGENNLVRVVLRTVREALWKLWLRSNMGAILEESIVGYQEVKSYGAK